MLIHMFFSGGFFTVFFCNNQGGDQTLRRQIKLQDISAKPMQNIYIKKSYSAYVYTANIYSYIVL